MIQSDILLQVAATTGQDLQDQEALSKIEEILDSLGLDWDGLIKVAGLAAAVAFAGFVVAPTVLALIRARKEKNRFAEDQAKRLAKMALRYQSGCISKMQYEMHLAIVRKLIRMNSRRVSTELHADLRNIINGIAGFIF